MSNQELIESLKRAAELVESLKRAAEVVIDAHKRDELTESMIYELESALWMLQE